MDIFIANPYPFPITVTLSSDKGSFVPSTIVVPPGGGNFSVEFYPDPGVTAGSTALLRLSSTIYPSDEDQLECFFQSEFTLPTPLCDNDSWKRVSGNDGEPADAKENKVEHFDVAPNPAQSEFSVDFYLRNLPSGARMAVEVYSVNGSRVYRKEVKNAAELNIRSQSWSPGVYLILLRVNEGTRHYRKLIVQ